jgi:hypothetical protein
MKGNPLFVSGVGRQYLAGAWIIITAMMAMRVLARQMLQAANLVQIKLANV